VIPSRNYPGDRLLRVKIGVALGAAIAILLGIVVLNLLAMYGSI